MAANNVVTLTDFNFDTEVLKSDIPVLVDFWAPWCGPCKAVAPTIEQLATEYGGKVKVGKLDIDQSQVVAQRYQISGIPTFLVFKAGKEVGKIVGAKPKREFVSLLDRNLG
jgi:thioredoxin 1